MTEKDAERQFEIEASTMDREQIYNLAKRQAVEIERLQALLCRDHSASCIAVKENQPCDCGWNEGTNNADEDFARELATLRRELAEARAKLDEYKQEAKERSLRD